MQKIQLSDHFTVRRLLRFSLPSIAMLIFTSVYGVVDGFFISNYVGKTPFAAVNFIMPFLMLLGALGFILGTGGSALVGKLLGEGKPEEANRVFSMLVCVGLAAGAVIAAAGIIWLPAVARFLGADETLLPLCVEYGRIVLLALPFAVMQYTFHSFFVTAEKPQLGFRVTVGAGVANILMDWLLVGVLRMDVVGAALATAASQLVGGMVPIVYFLRKNNSLLRLVKPRFDFRALLKTLGNGSSEFVSSVSMSLVSMLYNAQLMRYIGEDGVAAYGVLMYVNFIFISVFIGYAVGTAPIVSFHFGAQNKAELKSLLRQSLLIVSVFAFAMLTVSQILSRPLSALFVGYDGALMSMTLHAFYFFSFSFLFAALPIFGSSFFTALNDGFTSAAISFLRTVVFETASVLLLPLLLGANGIWLSLPAAELIGALATAVFLLAKRKKYGY